MLQESGGIVVQRDHLRRNHGGAAKAWSCHGFRAHRRVLPKMFEEPNGEQMTCDEVEEILLNAYVDGELDANPECGAGFAFGRLRVVRP